MSFKRGMQRVRFSALKSNIPLQFDWQNKQFAKINLTKYLNRFTITYQKLHHVSRSLDINIYVYLICKI